MGEVVPLNDESRVALEWREVSRRQRAAALATAEYLSGERLNDVLEFLHNVVMAEDESVQTPVFFEGELKGTQPPAIRDRIRAAAEIGKLLGLTRDTAKVQVAVGGLPSGRPVDEDAPDDPVRVIIAALELSAHDGGDNARLASFLARVQEDQRRQLAASPATFMDADAWETGDPSPVDDAQDSPDDPVRGEGDAAYDGDGVSLSTEGEGSVETSSPFVPADPSPPQPPAQEDEQVQAPWVPPDF